MTATPTRFIRASIVNEGKVEVGDVLIARDGTIGAVGAACDQHPEASEAIQIDAQGLWLMPGAIDDQVHFREPGLTHKGEIATESAAAAAGGITSFMEMPNTVPQALTQQLLEDKYERAAEVSAVNFSFFMGASNDNLDEVLKTDPRRVCGIKVFMGSSTGNMLVDNRAVLEAVFKESPTLVATHCEDEATIRRNSAAARERYGELFPSTSTRSSEAPKRVTARLLWRWNWPKSPTRACTFCTSQRPKKSGCSATTSHPLRSASRLKPASTTSGSPMPITPRKAPTSSGTPPSKQRRIAKPSAPAS